MIKVFTFVPTWLSTRQGFYQGPRLRLTRTLNIKKFKGYFYIYQQKKMMGGPKIPEVRIYLDTRKSTRQKAIKDL